jgi:hypothetical protein
MKGATLGSSRKLLLRNLRKILDYLEKYPHYQEVKMAKVLHPAGTRINGREVDSSQLAPEKASWWQEFKSSAKVFGDIKGSVQGLGLYPMGDMAMQGSFRRFPGDPSYDDFKYMYDSARTNLTTLKEEYQTLLDEGLTVRDPKVAEKRAALKKVVDEHDTYAFILGDSKASMYHYVTTGGIDYPEASQENIDALKEMVALGEGTEDERLRARVVINSTFTPLTHREKQIYEELQYRSANSDNLADRIYATTVSQIPNFAKSMLVPPALLADLAKEEHLMNKERADKLGIEYDVESEEVQNSVNTMAAFRTAFEMLGDRALGGLLKGTPVGKTLLKPFVNEGRKTLGRKALTYGVAALGTALVEGASEGTSEYLALVDSEVVLTDLAEKQGIEYTPRTPQEIKEQVKEAFELGVLGGTGASIAGAPAASVRGIIESRVESRSKKTLQNLVNDLIKQEVDDYRSGARGISKDSMKAAAVEFRTMLEEADIGELSRYAQEAGIMEEVLSKSELIDSIMKNRGRLDGYRTLVDKNVKDGIANSKYGAFRKQMYKWMSEGEVDVEEVMQLKIVWGRVAKQAGFDSVDAFFEENSQHMDGLGPKQDFMQYVQKNGLYSAVARELDAGLSDKPQKVETVRNLLKSLKNKGRIKQEELTDLGFEDWLDNIESTVTKAQIAEFIQQGGVQLEVVVQGDASDIPAGYSIRRENLPDRPGQSDLFDYVLYAPDGHALGHYENRETAITDAKLDAGVSFSSDTRYSQYQVPGGENYREVLLTIPGKKEVTESWRYGVGFHRGTADSLQAATEALERMMAAFPTEDRILEPYLRGVAENFVNAYESSHWRYPNVLVHLRLNDRIGPNGEKILFVEELQSDWHAEGREHGYDLNSWITPVPENLSVDTTDFDSLLEKYEEYYAEDKEGAGAAWDSAINAINEEAHEKGLPDNYRIEYVSYEDSYHIIRKETGGGSISVGIGTTLKDALGQAYMADRYKKVSGVPNAPMKRTETWVNLGFKKVLKEAVANGYDAIQIAGGDIQANRYDLSHHVSTIGVGLKPDFDGATREVFLDTKSGGSGDIVLYVNEQGKVIGDSTGPTDGAQFVGHRLDEVIGKDMASKVMEAKEPVDFSGLDLKVSNTGLKTLYDVIIPKSIQGYLRKLDKSAKVVGVDGVHTVKITDKIAESVREGQAFYQRGETYTSGAFVMKGRTSFLAEGKFLVDLFKGGDIVTLQHEFAHAMSPYISEKIISKMMDSQLDNIKYFLDSDRSKAARKKYMENVWKVFQANPLDSRFSDQNGADFKYLQGIQEELANQFQAYISSGKAPNMALTPAFRDANSRFVQYYKDVRGLPMEMQSIDPEVANMFDDMIADGMGDINALIEERGKKALSEAGKNIRKILNDIRNNPNDYDTEVKKLIAGVMEGLDPSQKTHARVKLGVQLQERLEGIMEQDGTTYEFLTLGKKQRDLISALDKVGIQNLNEKQITDLELILEELVRFNSAYNKAQASNLVGQQVERSKKMLTDNAQHWRAKGVMKRRQKRFFTKRKDGKGVQPRSKLEQEILTDSGVKKLVRKNVGILQNSGRRIKSLGKTIDRVTGKKSMHTILWEDLDSGNMKRLAMQRHRDNFFHAIMDNVNVRRISNAIGQVKKEDMIILDVINPEGHTVPISIAPSELMVWYGYMKNRHGRRHLWEGGIKHRDSAQRTYKFRSEEEMVSIVNQLSPELKQIVDRTMDYYDLYLVPQINELSQRLIGRDIATEDNYLPLFIEWLGRGEKGVTNMSEMGKENASFVSEMIEHMGFLKSRVGGSQPVYITDFFTGVWDNMQDVSLYVGLAEPIRNIKSTYFTGKGERDSVWTQMVDMISRRRVDQMEEFIRTLEDPSTRNEIETNVLMRMNQRVKRGIIKLATVIPSVQLLSLPLVLNKGLDAKYLLKAIGRASLDPDSFGLSAKYTREQLGERSPLLYDRFTRPPIADIGMSSKDRQALLTFTPKKSLLQKGKEVQTFRDAVALAREVDDMQMEPTKMVDALAISLIVEAAEYKAKKEGWTEQQMWDYIHPIIEETQPQTDPLYTSSFLQTKDSAIRLLFGPFQAFKDIVRGEIQTQTEIIRDGIHGQASFKEVANAFKALVRVVWTSNVVVALMQEIFYKFGKDDDDDEGNFLADWAIRSVANMMSIVPFFGDIAATGTNALLRGWRAEMSGTLTQTANMRVIEKLSQASAAWKRGDDEEGLRKTLSVIAELGTLFGLGTSNADRLIDKAEKLMD